MNHRRKPRLRAALDTRIAVRGALAGIPPGETVLVALSGGADSLALAAATAFEAGRRGLRAGAVVVDHGLQDGSAEVAARAAEQARSLGLAPVLVRKVEVLQDRGGVEAAAREARYGAFAAASRESGACALLVAHTRDDQAEQVLLALARGSGPRSLAGIPPERELAGAEGVRLLRPFLDERTRVTRDITERACAEQGLEPWHDPHNADPSYTRARVRSRLLPVMERELGPGVAAALARTADLAREDADALDALSADIARQLCPKPEAGEQDRAVVPVAGLAPLPPALRNRVIRRVASERLGAQLSRERTLAIAALLVAGRGHGPVDAPGITATRSGELLVLQRS